MGLEVDGYAYVGDALYSKVKDGYFIYNSQLLKEEIEVLKNLEADKLLVSHYDGLIREKDKVIQELESIYEKKNKNSHKIIIRKV